jgi:hypothetical protein
VGSGAEEVFENVESLRMGAIPGEVQKRYRYKGNGPDIEGFQGLRSGKRESSVVSPLLVFRTVRYLEPSQWIWRLRRKGASLGFPSRLSPPLPKAFVIDSAGLPGVPLPHHFTEAGSETIQALSQGIFTFLNQTKKLGFPETDWLLGQRREDRLWSVTLHYHEWAYSLARQAPALFITLISDWIKRCDLVQPGALALAWNPYAVATRIGWWCRCYAALGENFWREHPDFQETYLTSLWRQSDYLSRNVEWDLRANHVIRDGLGLAWAAQFFFATEDSRPKKWNRQATEILRGQIHEQVLPDGGHYERSPMYHLQVMEDLLQAACLLPDQYLKEDIREVWKGMADFAAWARHPDGEIPLLNDSALNGAGKTDEWLREAAGILKIPQISELRRGLQYFKDTGLVIWRGEPLSLFFDVGPLGPDEQPGHGHADNLTLELSWDKERLFVDPGVYAYDEDARRVLDRSTGSHNTVLVDGIDSSEVWKIFRVGRRAKPRYVEVSAFSDGFKARAGHDGYDHLSGKPCHFREIQLEENVFKLTDQVAGSGEHHLSGGFLLAPGWEVSVEEKGWKIFKKSKSLFFDLQGPTGLKWAVEKAFYHPEFGVEVPAQRLVWDWKGQIPFLVEFTLGLKEL